MILNDYLTKGRAMWTIDNIGEVLMRLGLFIVFPILCYSLYSLSDISIFIWLLASSVASIFIVAFFSPIIMITSFIVEGFFNLFSKE